MKYSILKYKPIIGITERYFAFEKNPKFMNKVGRLSEEYYHDYCGLYTGDDDDALSHAANSIDTLNVDPTDEGAKKSLISDTKNYFQCVYHEDERQTAYQLVKTIAAFGFFKELASIVEEYYQECEERAEDNNRISLCQALDFRKLYIKIADRLLFVDEDIDTALSFYKLAGAYWDTEYETINPTYHFENDVLSGLSEDKVDEWHEKSNLFERILRGYTKLDDSCLEIEVRDFDYTKAYSDIMEKAHSYEDECIDMMDNLINAFGERIDFADDQSRLVLFILGSIKRNRGVHVLYLLNHDDSIEKKYYKNEICSLFQLTTDKKYRELRKWINESEDDIDHKKDVVLNNVDAVYNVDKVLSLLRIESGEALSSAYYTSYSTFSLMLPYRCIDDRREECGRISVMNVAYMNDPNEGNTIKQYLYSNKIPVKQSERKEITAPYVFIKCFTSLIDYLPMWQMYGDAARGVCVITDWSKNDSVSMYKVCYLNKTGNNRYSIRKDQNPRINTDTVLKHIKALRHIQSKFKTVDEKLAFDAIISPILYLFKDASYSYEQEYRMMFSFEKSNTRIKHTKQNTEKLFVLSEQPIQIDELILGPCFENMADTLPFLREQLEFMAEKTGTVPAKITLSNIDFR